VGICPSLRRCDDAKFSINSFLVQFVFKYNYYYLKWTTNLYNFVYFSIKLLRVLVEIKQCIKDFFEVPVLLQSMLSKFFACGRKSIPFLSSLLLLPFSIPSSFSLITKRQSGYKCISSMTVCVLSSRIISFTRLRRVSALRVTLYWSNKASMYLWSCIKNSMPAESAMRRGGRIKRYGIRNRKRSGG
jgi:hypothetical protein